MNTIGPKYIIAEVAARHGVKIDAKDPMMAVVTLNELALMQFATPVVERIEDAERRFEKAAERLQERAGGVLTREVERASCTSFSKGGIEVLVDGLSRSR